MVVTDLDFEKLLNSIEASKNYKGRLPETHSALYERLQSAIKTFPQNVPADVVTMNSFVKVNWINTGITRTVNLVFPEYKKAGEGKISVFSSLGVVLLGRRKGSEVVYRIRNNEFRIKIMDVVFQPEANGHYYDKNEKYA
jgi:regulator of nucleoside diphosphate kinase